MADHGKQALLPWLFLAKLRRRAELKEKKPCACPSKKKEPEAVPMYSAPRPEQTTNSNWVSNVLVRDRGVLAAFPEGVLDEERHKRVLSVDGEKMAGRSWWWLERAMSTPFEQRKVYRPDRSVSVYRTSDAEQLGWLQDLTVYNGRDFSISEDGYEQQTLMGVTLTLQHYKPAPPAELEVHEQMGHVGPHVLMHLDAASAGIAPGVFATALVFEGDEYPQVGDSSGDASALGVPSTQGSRSGKIIGMLTASQYFSYQLSEMLHAFNTLGPADNVPDAEKTIFAFGAELAKKMRELATMGYIKMNMTPDTVVAVPKVSADESDSTQWRVNGFKFVDNERAEEVMEGYPMLWDFDPRFVKRIALGKSDFDADCSYAMMSLVLLASARSDFGNAYLPLYRQFMGMDVEGNLLPDRKAHDRTWLPEVLGRIRAGGKHSSLVNFMRSWRPTYFRQTDARLESAFDELARDFGRVVRSDLMGVKSSKFDGSKPLFRQFLCYVGATSQVGTPLFAPAQTGEEAEHCDQARRDRARLLTVVRAQRERWRKKSVNEIE